MEVKVQLQASTIKDHAYRSAKQISVHCPRNLLFLLGFQVRFLGRPARVLVSILTELTRLLHDLIFLLLHSKSFRWPQSLHTKISYLLFSLWFDVFG